MSSETNDGNLRVNKNPDRKFNRVLYVVLNASPRKDASDLRAFTICFQRGDDARVFQFDTVKFLVMLIFGEND
jgi:hypothetical protein